jgi:hypothetical protein
MIPENFFNSFYERYNEYNHRILSQNNFLSKINFYKFYFAKTSMKFDYVLQMLSHVVRTEDGLYVFVTS